MLSKYSLILSQNTSSDTKIPIFELCIYHESIFEQFIISLEGGNFETDLYGAIRNLELAANLISLPKTKFREIKGQKLDGKLYEAKYGFVRIYHFQEKFTGRIIVIGGLKSDQEQDIKKVVKTIKEYHHESK